MVASTDIKFYVHTNNNAPQLQNSYGSMINVLDACLIDGINIGDISSLTVSGTTVTALFSSAHNLIQYQVFKIVGANQSDFNGEHRILTVPNAQTITFELEIAPAMSAATGIITASLPPIGWDKPFSSSNPNGGGKAAYRSKNTLLQSRPFLRVVDELDLAYTASYAKYAKVGIVEDMTDINTMLGVQAPFDTTLPNKNWVGTGSGATVINGWAKWYYASAQLQNILYPDNISAGSGIRNWMLIGTGDYFYIIPSFNLLNPGLVYGFGSFKSLLISDSANNFLSCTLQYTSASGTDGTAKDDFTGFTKTALNNSVLIQRGSSNPSLPSIAKTYSNPFSTVSASNNNIANQYLQGGLLLFPVFIFESNTVLRGVAPNIKNAAQVTSFVDREAFIVDEEIFLTRDTYIRGADTKAQVFFSLGVR